MENEINVLEERNKKSLKFTRIVMFIVGLIPVILVACLYSKMPDKIPGHWEVNNIRYDPKWTSFITSLLPLIMFGLSFLATTDKFLKKTNGTSTKMQKNIVCDFFLALELFLCSLQIVVLIETFAPNTVIVSKVIPFIIGLLMIIIGNILPKMPVKKIKDKTDEVNVAALTKRIKEKRVIGLLTMLFGIVLAVISWVCSSFWLVVIMACAFVLCIIIALIATR